jgi:hypothetical protein
VTAAAGTGAIKFKDGQSVVVCFQVPSHASDWLREFGPLSRTGGKTIGWLRVGVRLSAGQLWPILKLEV